MVGLLPDIRELEAVRFLTVNVKHGKSRDGSAESSEVEDEHRGGIGGVVLIGLAYTHGDDGTSEVLDKEDHRVCCAQAF